MIGPGATRGFASGAAVGISGTGRPAALKAAAITTFGVERVTRLSFFTPSKESFGRIVRAFGGWSSDDKGGVVCWNLNRY
jgi:hypothetical protein